jgi:SAM-dependent methyltransferase
MKTYEQAELTTVDGVDTIIIDGVHFDAIVGKHSVWVPGEEVKIVWSHCGRIESYKDWDLGRNKEAVISGSFAPVIDWDDESRRSIIVEWHIMKKLAAVLMSPMIGDIIHIKKFISTYPYGVEFCDVRGRYGYEMEDANFLLKGSFRKGSLKKVFGDRLKISDGAIGDVYKEDNVVNGYLIDVRRTLWDMMTLDTDDTIDELIVKHDINAIMEKVKSFGQFPYKERKQPYQDYYLDGEYREGSRSTEYRFKFMGIESVVGNVLDLGCAIGSMAIESYRLGALKVLGMDFQKEYIDCARDIAMVNSYPINFVQMDITNVVGTSLYIEKFFCERRVDIVFALSLFKHIKFRLFDLLASFDWGICFIESNNAPEELETLHVKQIIKGIERLKGDFKLKVDYLGQTGDRSPRCVWRLERGV